MQVKDDHTGPWFDAFAFRLYEPESFFAVFQYDNLVVGSNGFQATFQDPDIRFVILNQDDSVLAHLELGYQRLLIGGQSMNLVLIILFAGILDFISSPIMPAAPLGPGSNLDFA
jgi:hypothetical protein